MRTEGSYPAQTVIWRRIDRLILSEGKRLPSERMATRMVKCASALGPGGFLGWQMLVAPKGLAKMSLFGSEALNVSDLEWIAEKTGKLAGVGRGSGPMDLADLVYELFLPAAEPADSGRAIGFGGALPSGQRAGETVWPSYLSSQSAELIQALRVTGGTLRVVAGPADQAEQSVCRRQTQQNYHSTQMSIGDYIGRPVRFRVLLRLPSTPSIRLRAVLEEAVKGVRLRCLGSLEHPEIADIWERPLENAPVLPEYAARVMTLEPELWESVVGVKLCEEPARPLPASHKNPSDSRSIQIGKAVDAAGFRRKITLGELDLKRHYQIVGQTGTGKSTLLSTMILSAIEQDYGLTFFDPHGSTIDLVLRALPERFADRVRVVRIGDAENPVPLNIWDSEDPDKEERNISDLCELFGDLFNPPGQEFVGPRYERWLSTFARASIAFLGRASLESIAVISQSQNNMLKLSKAIYNRYPELVETIKQEYGTDKSSDFNATLNWYLCKFQRLISVEQLRKTLGARTNALDFPETIDTNTVTLIDLASPVIGTHAARIVGTLLLMKLWNAALTRKDRKKTHLVVVDEAALFQTNPMPRMLAESRKFGLSMVLCHQHAGQFSKEILEALEANSASFSAFRLSPRDAVAAAARLDDRELAAALPRLDAFRAVTSLSVNGVQSPPFTLETTRPKPQKNGETVAAAIERRSREQLVEPYRELRALTAKEIQALLDDPDCSRKTAPKPEKPPFGKPDPLPDWLGKWDRRKNRLNYAV